MGLSNLLGTSVGQSEQDDLMKQDVQGYINKGKELGISDPKALAYFADLYNQSPAQAIAIAKASNGSLDSLYKASMSNSVMSKYASRREDAYEAAKGITSSSGDAGGDSVASWYLDSYNITSGFGSQESFRSSSHKGVDLDGQLGDPIKAILGGVVESIKTSASAKDGSGYGNYVRIKHDDGTYSQYSHLQDVNVKAGQKISSGQLIATMGNTGSVVGADGSHLDLTYYDKSMKNLNPESWLKGLANGDAGGDSVSQAYLDAGGDNVKALTDAVKENTSATKDSTTQQASKGLLTNVSAYDPFSGIHPTNMLDYNKSTFNLYKNLDSKGISYNDQGVDMQAYSKAARKQFDINLKTSVDPSQHPNFTEIMDKHMKVAVANAVKEATSDIEGNFTSQFSELWSTAASQVEKAKDY
jgi:murein DD-endopeptidase MepM/ murein hydrolase activator NlpD